MFILGTKAFFYREHHQILFLGVFCIKRNVNKISNFSPTPRTNPVGKIANFVGFWNRCFPFSERLVCYIKRRKSFFHDLFSRSMTCEYRGLKGVTGGYKGLQGVSGGYKGLQGVTGGDKGYKCQFCWFSKPMFSLFRKACLLHKTSKTVSSWFIFTIYDMGIPGITRGYKGFQGVTRGYRG